MNTGEQKAVTRGERQMERIAMLVAQLEQPITEATRLAEAVRDRLAPIVKQRTPAQQA
jgi:hypothetical protein